MSDQNIAPAIHERKGHTPGPYLRNGSLVYTLDESRTCNRISIRVEGGFVQNWKSVCRLTTDEEVEATAEFAQRACNSHYALLEALKAVLFAEGGPAYNAAIALARAAITKAEG